MLVAAGKLRSQACGTQAMYLIPGAKRSSRCSVSGWPRSPSPVALSSRSSLSGVVSHRYLPSSDSKAPCATRWRDVGAALARRGRDADAARMRRGRGVGGDLCFSVPEARGIRLDLVNVRGAISLDPPPISRLGATVSRFHAPGAVGVSGGLSGFGRGTPCRCVGLCRPGSAGASTEALVLSVT